MDSKSQSSSPESADARAAAFRKPANDAANRKYRRRRSPISGSSSSDGVPYRERSSSPILSRQDHEKVSEHPRRKDDRRELDRDADRSQYGRSENSNRHSNLQPSRSSHYYNRHDDYRRREKHADDYSKLSSHSSRESRGGDHAHHTRRESEHSRSRDHLRNVDKYSREKSDSSGHRSRDKERHTSFREYKKYYDKDLSSDRAGSGRRHTNLSVEEFKSGEQDRHIEDRDTRDEKREHSRSLGDYKSDHSPAYEESRGHRSDSTSRRDSSGHRFKEVSKSSPKELDGKKYSKEGKKKNDDQEINRHKERYNRESGEKYDGKCVFTGGNEASAAKKPKFSLDSGTDCQKRVSKFTTIADEQQSSSSKRGQEFVDKMTSEHVDGKDSEASNDVDAAKIAAMKAAELVNRNLIGTGYLSTDQKKKLLWGNKKSTTTEESVHRWDTTLFSDRERQEKFNKLMGVKGEMKMEHKPEEQDGIVEKQKELQLDLEKQYTAGLRRRDGRTVGLGL